MSNIQLTDEQIENWRRVLSGMIGPYAFIMPKKLIQEYRDRMQDHVNSPEVEAQVAQETAEENNATMQS